MSAFGGRAVVAIASGDARWRRRLWRSALRADSPALLALRGCRITRCAHCVRYAQTGCGKSVHEARCARPPQGWPCRPRRARRPGRSQGTNGPLDRLCPCSPARRPTRRRPRAPPAARARGWRSTVRLRRCLRRAVRAGRGGRVKRRGAQGSWPASAASLVDTSGASCLSVANEVSAASYAPGHGPDALSPDTNSPVDCLCLAKDRASGPGRSTMGGAPQARFVL